MYTNSHVVALTEEIWLDVRQVKEEMKLNSMSSALRTILKYFYYQQPDANFDLHMTLNDFRRGHIKYVNFRITELWDGRLYELMEKYGIHLRTLMMLMVKYYCQQVVKGGDGFEM